MDADCGTSATSTTRYVRRRLLEFLGTELRRGSSQRGTAVGAPRCGWRPGTALPVYPDASLVLPQGDIRSAIAESKKDDMETATYHANVSSDFVDSWYSKHLSREFVRNDATVRPRPEVLRRAGVPDNDIAFIGERDHQIRIVAIAQDPAGTDITLLHFAK